MLFMATIFLVESVAQPVMSMQSSTGGRITIAPSHVQNATTVPDEAKADFRKLQTETNRQVIEAMKTGFGGRDPAMRDLMSIDVAGMPGMIPNFANAPIDADPFFMRSQNWVDSNQVVKDFGIIGDNRSTEILVPNSRRKLVLDVPLRSLIATDEYLFFTLHPQSDLFDRLSGVQNSEGEGLFVIETALLAHHAQKKTPVPLHFLPIMGKGWKTGVTAMQVVQGDILAVSNSTEVIPFLMKDIREMIQLSKINLDISVMISLTKRGSDGKVADERLMPAPGSTALLGLVVTGLDTSRPGYNFFRDFRSLSANVKPRFENVASRSLIMKVVNLFKIQQANAQSGEDPVTIAIKRTMVFGSIVGITIVTAFALKYKSQAVRQRLDEIRKYRRALDPATVDAEKMRGVRDFLRIEGSILASIAQFPLITPGIAVQYFVDRHMPNLGSGDHTLMRKVLNQTIYPNLRHFGKVSVNEKVTLLGTGYAATAGIGMGALHYYYLLPMFIGAVSPSLPDGLSYALNESFSSENRNTQAMLFTNLLVGASIGILRGPADFTMDAKSQVVEELYARVDNDLRRLGINPDDPKVQSRREEMREALVNLTLVQKGLPSTAEILFDTMSLYSSIAKARGFATPNNDTLVANLNPLAADSAPYEKDKDGKIKIGVDGKPIIQEGNFILTSRRGLLPSVLDRALAQAKAWHQLNPSADTEKALRLVEHMISDSERLRNVLPKAARTLLRYMEEPSLLTDNADPVKKAARDADLKRLQDGLREINTRALAFRQLIVMSNYEGPTEYTARYLPVSWTKDYGSSATNMAVLYLRQALASQLDGANVDNIVAKSEDITRYRYRGQSEAVAEMQKQRPELANMTEAAILADANLRAEVLQRANIQAKHLGEEQRAEEAAERYKPDSGWIDQFRHRGALNRAEARLARYSLENSDKPEMLSKENLEARLREFYTYESGKQIGLRIQGLSADSDMNRRGAGTAPWQSENAKYETMLKEIQEKTELLVSRQLETVNVKTYMAKLSSTDQTRLKMQFHASVFLAGYRDATTMTDVVHAVDSAQPGMTQVLRQALTRQTEKDLKTLEDLEAERTNRFDKKLTQIRRRVVSVTASTVNRGLRIVDSMFNDQAVDRGALGVIQRRVPFAEELVSANIRNLKFWPVAFSVSWAWSHFALGTGIGYSFWVTSILTQGIFVMLPVQWLFRNYRMQAFKPYDSNKPGWKGVFHLGGKYGIAETLGYAVTFIAIMPAVLLTTEVGQLLTQRIGTPLTQSMQSFSFTEVSAVALTGLLSYIAGSKVYEQWKMKRTFARLTAFEDKAKSTEAVDKGGAPVLSCERMFIPVAH